MRDEGESEKYCQKWKNGKTQKTKRLGMYKEGKSWVEKIIKETFNLMRKKSNKVIKDFVKS